jgi:hypothetical protein
VKEVEKNEGKTYHIGGLAPPFQRWKKLKNKNDLKIKQYY